MSAPQDIIDPRLGAGAFGNTPQFSDGSQRTGAPAGYGTSGRSDNFKTDGSVYQSPQPYYTYPSPQTQTPRQSVGHSVSQSAQASPDGQFQTGGEHTLSPEQDDGQGADDPKRPRACEACRGLKVRCDQDPQHPEIPCKRCAKAGRQCIITQPSRKRQKKADSRVAELEKKLDALTAALNQQQAGTAHYGMHQSSGSAAGESSHARGNSVDTSTTYVFQTEQRPASADDAVPSNKRRRIEGPSVLTSYDRADEVTESHLSRNPVHDTGTPPLNTPANPNVDLKVYLSAQSPEEFVYRINSLINPDMATTIFNRYVSKLAPNLPAVVFPAGTTAEQVFKEKPILYVCILSAASHGQLHPDISKQIAKEAVGAIADCVVRNGAKSLELIQAMQVTALWYKPPERAEQTNFYQIIHMAAVMALDIGLGKRFNPAKARRGFGGPNAQYAPGPHKTLPQDSDTLEARRAWLGCYFLCASASMVLRRPNLVRWTNYMKECLEVLESHPDAFPSDKLFCQHVKIQHICEEIGLQFLMDDNTANISITDPKVTYALSVLEHQLKSWKEQIPLECRTPGLAFFEHVTALYLHEIALHFNHNVEDFRLPFTEESLKTVNNTSDTLTQSQMSALEACLKAAHGILDTILSMDIPTVKTLPMFIYFVRCTYAIVVLIKMHVAVCTPNSELGKMMKPEDLKVDFYINNLIALFSYVAKEEEFRPHPKILRILSILRDWFGKHKENVAAQQRGEQPLDKAQQTLEKEQIPQTPLHLLSQVATGNPPVPQNDPSGGSEQGNWTFNSPVVFDYRPGDKRRLNATDAKFPVNQQQQFTPQGVYPDAYAMPANDGDGIMDPINTEYWGTNFEQAMDMALGSMDGLQATTLDGWFLGDSMAPFTFSGEMATGWTGGA